MINVEKANFKEINDKIIIDCPECSQRLRLPLFKTKKISIKCSNCNLEFVFDYKVYHHRRIFLNSLLFSLVFALLSLAIVLPIFSIYKIKEKIKTLNSEQALQVDKLKKTGEKEISIFKSRQQGKLSKIDNNIFRGKLRKKAANYYAQEWNERKKFNARYAITPREKAQLEMSRLARGRNKKLEDVIKGIAAMASPKNSTISVHKIRSGIRLDIDFDMSTVTAGEIGTKTKHNTIVSLKKEVVDLVSRVTNDVYNFCQDLNLASIAIGCRHYVTQAHEENKVLNKVLYKIRLDKKDLKRLESNPFLDIYSTTNYFKIEEDNFKTITIVKTKR